MRRRFRPVWLLPFAAPVAFLCVILYFAWDDYRPRPQIPLAPARSITTSNLPLRGLPPVDRCLSLVDDDALMATGHLLAYPTSDGTPWDIRIRLYDVYLRSEVWDALQVEHPYSLSRSATALFASSSTQVRAYDIHTGELLWASQSLPGHTGNDILPDLRKGLTIYYTSNSLNKYTAVIRRLDPDTGEIHGTDQFPLPESAGMAPYPDLAFIWVSGERLWLAPPPPAPSVWQVDTGGSIADWPVKYRNTLVVSSGFFPRILAIDARTGATIWQDDREFSSTPVIFNGAIYSITRSAQLVALDPEDGHELAHAQFAPGFTEETTRSRIYALAASDEILGVYFGDSCQMFVFTSLTA